MGLIEAALKDAIEAHEGQTDLAGKPYIWHPIRVAMKMQSEVDQVVALLHDTVEDSPEFTIERVRNDYGAIVAGAVDALTRRPEEEYFSYVERAGQNPIALRVKTADLEDNLDASRMSGAPTARDLDRCEKYWAARDILGGIRRPKETDND